MMFPSMLLASCLHRLELLSVFAGHWIASQRVPAPAYLLASRVHFWNPTQQYPTGFKNEVPTKPVVQGASICCGCCKEMLLSIRECLIKPP